MEVLNLTRHYSTPEQRNDGVIEPTEEDKQRIRELLTFDEIPTVKEIKERAEELADIAETYDVRAAMIAGAPFILSSLENALKKRGIAPLYSFATREAVEEQLPDGTVVKKSLFKHLGFVLVL